MAWNGRSADHGGVAVGNQAVEFPLVGQGAEGQGAGHAGHGDERRRLGWCGARQRW